MIICGPLPADGSQWSPGVVVKQGDAIRLGGGGRHAHSDPGAVGGDARSLGNASAGDSSGHYHIINRHVENEIILGSMEEGTAQLKLD